MKNNLKIFMAFLIGVIVSGTVVYAISSGSITFEPNDENWNVSTVEEAINDLYLHTDAALSPTLIWTNPNPTSNFAAQTIEMNLSSYKYIIVLTNPAPTVTYLPRSSAIIPVTETCPTNQARTASTGSGLFRNICATGTGITISAAYTTSNSAQNDRTIPYKIYGIRGELGIDLGLTD